MTKNRIILIIVIVILIAVVLQAVFVLAGPKDKPSKAAVQFSKAYFSLDETMSQRLCGKLQKLDYGQLVDNYLYRVTKDAEDRGFKTEMATYLLYRTRTEIISQTDSAAQVRLTAKRRVAINLPFAVIAMIFDIGETYRVDETLDLVQEDGTWRVCGSPFNLIDGIL